MRPRILIIAGSDSSGGAGLSKDVETIANHGGSARPVITAITVQTNSAVAQISHSAPELVAAQISTAMDDGKVDAVKIGMLGNAAIVDAVAKALQNHSEIPIILDPVLAATSGAQLLDIAGRKAMTMRLFPLVKILTPNRPEAALLCNSVGDHQTARQARHLVSLGPQYILMKGGHSSGNTACDELHDINGYYQKYCTPRLAVAMRGTGCMQASALACNLAAGLSVPDACATAKNYVYEKLLRNQNQDGVIS